MNTQNRVQRILLGSNLRSNDLSTLNQENFERLMAESLYKAIDSPDRSPVKEKHVRVLLIGSFQAQSGAFLWKHLLVIRLKEEMLVCWKFCYVLHKMVRDGPRQMVKDSNEHKKVLLDCGNMWRYVSDFYGKLIHRYCSLLYNRINFLMRHPQFPNDLKMNEDLISNIDINVLFDFTCELFDALEDVERLVIKALDAFEKNHLSSSSNAGKCLLAPLVACVQDASLLYDYCIKVMFKLHTSLDVISLSGHRSRFEQIHKEFYWIFKRTRDLQYFRTLLQIPNVSLEGPNFWGDVQRHPESTRVTVIDNSSDSIEELESQPLVEFATNLDANLTNDIPPYVESQDPSSREQGSEPMKTNVAHELPLARSKSELEGILQDYESRIEELEEETSRLKGQVELEKGQKLELEREFSDKSKSNEASHQAQIDELKAQIKKLQDESKNLKAQLTNSKSLLDKMKEECEKGHLDAEISNRAMRKMAEDVNQLKRENEQMKGIPRQTEAEIKRSQEEKSKHRATIEDLRKLLEETKLELKERDTECKKLRNEHEELTSSKAKLVEQLDEQQSKLLMSEMDETDKIIKEATLRIEELSEKSRKLETGIKLQVNEKISQVCTNLMKAVRNLIIQSDLLQREVVAVHGVSNNVEEFYKRNSAWTDGLISAAKVVAIAAKSLVDAADRAMAGDGKYTQLSAAAHEIAAATTQLVVASRVKANKDSEKLRMLTVVAKQVNQCTGNVVDTAKICADLIERDLEPEIDVDTLTLHQTKKLEIETQVKLLDLEAAISKERIKLGILRRKHYEQEEAQLTDSRLSK